MKNTGTKRIIRYYDEIGDCNVVTLETYTVGIGWHEIERHEKQADGNFQQKDPEANPGWIKGYSAKVGQA